MKQNYQTKVLFNKFTSDHQDSHWLLHSSIVFFPIYESCLLYFLLLLLNNTFLYESMLQPLEATLSANCVTVGPTCLLANQTENLKYHLYSQ